VIYVTAYGNKFYGMAEFGITMMGATIEAENVIIGFDPITFVPIYGDYEEDIDSESEFGFAVGAGYIMDKFDFSVTYNAISDWTHIGFRVGYKFM
jgi:hypothetical protein